MPTAIISSRYRNPSAALSGILQESFDRKECLRLTSILSIPTTSADRYIKKWLEEGKRDKVEHGKYWKRGE